MPLQSRPDLEACIDRLATRFASRPQPGEIERARRQFDAMRGRIYDDDELYPIHMAFFLEWFGLERPQLDGRPAVLHALAEGRGDGVERQRLWALAHGQRSLFQLQIAGPGSVLVLDLLRGGRWEVACEHPMNGLEAGDIFEARIVPWEGRVVFGPAFLFHPRQARPLILDILRQGEQSGWPSQRLMAVLAEMRLRYSRFRNIAVERIYLLTHKASSPEPTSGTEPRA